MCKPWVYKGSCNYWRLILSQGVKSSSPVGPFQLHLRHNSFERSLLFLASNTNCAQRSEIRTIGPPLNWSNKHVFTRTTTCWDSILSHKKLTWKYERKNVQMLLSCRYTLPFLTNYRVTPSNTISSPNHSRNSLKLSPKFLLTLLEFDRIHLRSWCIL